MAIITVRKVDPITFDPMYGNGQNNFLSDIDAVVQIINTRLRLFQGEWFLNLLDGLPMFDSGSGQQILGSSGSPQQIQVIINFISNRITGSPYVTGILSLSAKYFNRSLTYSAKVNTAFGVITVSNQPGSKATLQN